MNRSKLPFRTLAAGLFSLLLLGTVGCSRQAGPDTEQTIIQNAGSDTMVNVAQAWAEQYADVAPDGENRTVHVDLVEASSGRGLWSKTYTAELDLDGRYRIQERIVRQVVADAEATIDRLYSSAVDTARVTR